MVLYKTEWSMKAEFAIGERVEVLAPFGKDLRVLGDVITRQEWLPAGAYRIMTDVGIEVIASHTVITKQDKERIKSDRRFAKQQEFLHALEGEYEGLVSDFQKLLANGDLPRDEAPLASDCLKSAKKELKILRGTQKICASLVEEPSQVSADEISKVINTQTFFSIAKILANSVDLRITLSGILKRLKLTSEVVVLLEQL
jgi:hypothetical protein